jgi:glycerol-3-phosphate dehydrogenase
VLVGTTDTDFSGDPERVAPTDEDVAYLLAVLGENFPALRLSRRDVALSFAALRALAVASARLPASSVSRQEVILEAASGMITVAGGKLTTHRHIAERVVDRVMKRLGRSRRERSTAELPLPGARRLSDVESAFGDEASLASLPPRARRVLTLRYGSRAAIPARLIHDNSALARPLWPGCLVLGAEVVHAVRFEMARTVSDVLARRIGLAWRYPVEAEKAAPAVAGLMAGELDWNTAREQAEIVRFASEFHANRLTNRME